VFDIREKFGAGYAHGQPGEGVAADHGREGCYACAHGVWHVADASNGVFRAVYTESIRINIGRWR
jgi:hypothetical protein